ncbi:MAG: dihydrolipoamide succinyltransferase, partial [Clostridia bacterium]
MLAALALAALAGTLFAAGTRPALAPEACVPEVTLAAPQPAEAEAAEPAAPAPDASQRALSAYFARRYMVAAQATSRWVAA